MAGDADAAARMHQEECKLCGASSLSEIDRGNHQALISSARRNQTMSAGVDDPTQWCSEVTLPRDHHLIVFRNNRFLEAVSNDIVISDRARG
ncbi:hypothetical protein [Methylorubrum thiocyanatum]